MKKSNSRSLFWVRGTPDSQKLVKTFDQRAVYRQKMTQSIRRCYRFACGGFSALSRKRGTKTLCYLRIVGYAALWVMISFRDVTDRREK